MSARIVPLSVLCFLLLAIFYAVVATAQEPAPGSLIPAQQVAPADATISRNLAGIPEPNAGGFLGLPAAQPLPTAPFTLTPEEETNLNRVLVDWQNMSGKVTTFESDFVRWDYDGVFGAPNVPARVSSGVIKYAGPDKGSYEHWQIDPKTQQKVADEKFNEKWICTGDAVFQFRYDLKQVREHKLPENMRGKAIADGPMPFVFGVEAVKMRQRYWIRVTTPQEAANQSQVWLEAYPKEAKDAANFYKLDIILTFVVENGQVVKLEPYAINMVLPNQKDRTVYRLSGQKANTQLQNIQQWFGNFIRPSTPLTWTHQVVEETAPPAGPESQPAPGIGAVPQPTVPR